MRLADEDHLRRRDHLHQTLQRPQRFGDSLVRLQVSEDADERRGFIDAQSMAIFQTILPLGQPCAVRDHGDGSRKTSLAHLAFDKTAMRDHAAGMIKQRAQHGDAFIIGAALERLNMPLRPGKLRRTGVVLHFMQVAVPVVTADGEFGDQVVQVCFVEDHDARPAQRRFIAEGVVGVVADLIEKDVVAHGVEIRRNGRNTGDVRERFEFVQQGRRIIGDAASCRRQR